MKSKLFNILILFSIVLSSYSQDKDKHEKHEREDPKFKKEKSYTKSYSISNSDKISLDNQFGEMKLITWTKNEVKVDVSITGMSDDESRAQQILDKISIVDEKTGGGVSFKTKMANDEKDKGDKNKNEKGEKEKHMNEGMKINYTVYLPSGNPLNAKNHFGAMIVPDYTGEATIESQFGSLTAGKISNNKMIHVGFGKADIEHVNNGTIKISYSSATINKLSGDIDAKFQFSDGVKLNVDNDVKSLEINNSYSTIYLDLSKSLSASFAVSNSFSSFENKSNFQITENSKGDRNYSNSSSFSGKAGGGDNKITIHSSFGSVIAGHDLKIEKMKKKKSANI